MKVLVYNTDGVNAYAAEVAGLLQGCGAVVTLVDAANGEHRPPDGVRWCRLLPANFGSESRFRQLLSLLRGVSTSLWAAAARRHVVLVAYTRFPLEDFAFAALAALGRPVVAVVHNPVPREVRSFLARRARRALLHNARYVVVHAESLREEVDPAAAGRVVACIHPPYRHTGKVDMDDEAAPSDRRWVAFIGTLRRDKGVHLLPEVFARIPDSERRRLGLVICGRGELSVAARTTLRELGVAVQDLSSPSPVAQRTLLGVLARRPLVVAPYVAATQSGTVILALTAGCRVLAFDKGGIPDVLSADGLVRTGDLDAFARAVAEGRGGTAVLDLDEWARRAADDWCRLVASCAGGTPKRRGRGGAPPGAPSGALWR